MYIHTNLFQAKLYSHSLSLNYQNKYFLQTQFYCDGLCISHLSRFMVIKQGTRLINDSYQEQNQSSKLRRHKQYYMFAVDGFR